MATTVKTFNWTSNADSFTYNDTLGNGSGAWSSTGGDADAGCLQNDVSGRNKDSIGTWARTLTFEDMGVTAGHTVTGITSASIKTKVLTYSGGVNSATLGTVTLSDGTTTVTLAASRSPTATDSTFQTQSGTDNTSLNWASTQSVTITLNFNIDVGNQAGLNFDTLWDTLTFTITHAPALTHYTLTADQQSYTLTGNTTGLEAGRDMPAALGTFTLTGIAAALTKGQTLTADLGTYSLTGFATGLDADRTLTADQQSYTLTGFASGLDAGRDLTAALGTYTLTGNDATLTKGGAVSEILYVVVYSSALGEPSAAQIKAGQDATGGAAVFADSKTVTVTGPETFNATGLAQDTGYKASFIWSDGTNDSNIVTTAEFVTRTIEAVVQTYTLTGQAANLEYGRRLVCDVQTYSLTGQAADLLQGYDLPADLQTYTLTGYATGLTADYTLTADTQSYTLTGYAAGLDYSGGAAVLPANTGAFTLTGFDVNLPRTYELTADPGAFTLSGIAANLEYGRTLTADQQSYTVTGYAANFPRGLVLSADLQTYTLTGNNVTLTYSGQASTYTLSGTVGAFTFSGIASTLKYMTLADWVTYIRETLGLTGVDDMTFDDLHSMILEIWRIMGLDSSNPMTVTPTSRDAADISQAITGDGTSSTTVTRQ